MDLHHDRHDQQGYDVDDLDQWVDGRAGGVLVGVAHGVAGHGGLVRFRALAAKVAVFNVLFGIVPGTAAGQALDRLKAGNARFVAGQSHLPSLQTEILSELAEVQEPYATILGCSDSRVPPELVFDAWLGELFIIRVAGNVLGPTIAGTLQYAANHLHTPLFVVMGHEGCGAIQAAVATKFHDEAHPERVADLLKNILPALDGIDPALPPEEFLLAAVEANVRHTVRILRDSTEGQKRFADGLIQLVGAVYSLHTGRVRFLED